MEAAKKSVFAKKYWFDLKQFMDMGKWDIVLKVAQNLAILDEDNNTIAPPQADHDAANETIDLVVNPSEEEKVEE